MHENNTTPDNLIGQLTPIEKKILLECGKLNITVKKNIREETIKKKMPNDYLKDFNKSLKHLISIGLIVVYRPHNYGLSQKGRIIPLKLKNNHQKDLYSSLRILMFMDYNQI